MFHAIKSVVIVALLGACAGCANAGPLWVQDKLYTLETGTLEEKVEALREVQSRPEPALRTALQNTLRTDPDPVARALAASALGELGNRYSVTELRLSARRDVAEIVRAQALEALYDILGSDVRQDIEFALSRDAAPYVRASALELASDALSGRERLALLWQGLNDDAMAVRITAYLYLKDLTGLDISPGDVEEWRKKLGLSE
jgi:HEAT repeat protein